MRTTFGRVAPTLYVTDLERALGFWTEQLGFELRFTNGEPARFAVVARDAAEVHLAVDPSRAGHGHCHILVEGLADLVTALTAADTQLAQPPTDQPWGLRDILLTDPDGNSLEIAEPIT